jgi:hypothetical protein
MADEKEAANPGACMKTWGGGLMMNDSNQEESEPTFRIPSEESPSEHPNDRRMRAAMIQTQLIRYEQELEDAKPRAWNPLLDENQDDYGSQY